MFYFCLLYRKKAKDVSWKLHLLAKYSNKLTRSKSEEIHVMLFVYWKENWCSTICFTKIIMILFSSFSYLYQLCNHILHNTYNFLSSQTKTFSGKVLIPNIQRTYSIYSLSFILCKNVIHPLKGFFEYINTFLNTPRSCTNLQI